MAQCGAGYVEPSFQLTKTDETCTLNDGSISVTNLTGGAAPFTFTIVTPSPYNIGLSNSTGTFTNLPAGNYYIQLTDACGTIRVRQVTIIPYNFSFQFQADFVNCKTYHVSITPNNASYQYGVILSGVTTWQSSNDFDFTITNESTVGFLVKDACGNIQQQNWDVPPQNVAWIEAIDNYFWCDGWDATVAAHGFTNPTYCMYYAPTNTLVACNNTGFFPHLPYGGYYAIVSDDCYRDSFYKHTDTAAGGVQLDVFNTQCNDFTIRVDGFGDTVCLYSMAEDSSLTLYACNTITQDSANYFTHLPYGTYCAYIFDPCTNQTIKICKGVYYRDTLSLNVVSSPVCSFDTTALSVYFTNNWTDWRTNNPPFTYQVFDENDNLLQQGTTPYNVAEFRSPSVAGQYKIVGIDNCGASDTMLVTPRPLQLNKSLTVIKRCPGATWTDGSGDVNISATSNLGTVSPVIIKKNGDDISINPSYSSVSTSYFLDLEPANYIVSYRTSNCTILVTDSFTVEPYALPVIGTNITNQCATNNFLLTLNVIGISPFIYEIIGSTPSTPSIITSQNSPDFLITATYSVVETRVIDVCGNSALKDILVEPCNILRIDSSRLHTHRNAQESDIKIYPNPSSSSFHILFDKNKKQDYEIEIINTIGQKVYSDKLFGIDRKDYEVHKLLAKGQYFIRINNQIFTHLIQ